MYSDSMVGDKINSLVLDSVYLNGPMELSEIKEYIKANGFNADVQRLSYITSLFLNHITWRELSEKYRTKIPFGKNSRTRIYFSAEDSECIMKNYAARNNW